MFESFILFLLLALPGPTPVQDANATPTFRVTASEVVVEFIAVEKSSGRYVTDLTEDEILVKIDGKKQKLLRLLQPSQVNDGFQMLTTPTESPSAGSTGSQKPPGQLVAKRTVIVLDTRTLDASNFHHSISAIREFIAESLRTDHLVMLAEIEQGLEILSPFTRDRSRLLEVLDSLKPATVYNPLDPRRMTTNVGEQYFEELQKQVVYLRSGLRLLCHSLSALPGRKQVVFFSEGYPLNPNEELVMATGQATAFGSADERQAASRQAFSRKDPGVLSMVTEVVSLANLYGVTFYTIDARGLAAVPGIGEANVAGDLAAGPGEATASRVANFEESETGATEINLTTFQLTNLSSLEGAHNTLTALAGGTNGSAFYNSNDLAAVLRASTSEQGNAYLAGFAQKGKAKAKFHRVQVNCLRPGVVVRSQVGYLDVPPEEAMGARIVAAMTNPEFFQHLEPVLQFEPATKEMIFGIPGTQIMGRSRGDETEIELIFVGRVFDSQGKPVSDNFEINRGFKLGLTGEQFQSLAFQPVLARQEMNLPSGKYVLRLVADDRVAGTMGVRVGEFILP